MTVEIESDRTYTSKTFDEGGGVHSLKAFAGHIHYDDNGSLADVDLTFEDMGAYWQCTKASYQLYVSKQFDADDLIKFVNRYEGANHSIFFRPHSIWWVNADDKTQRTKWKDRQAVTGSLNAAANEITFADAFGSGVDFRVLLRRSGFAKFLELPAKPPTGSAPYLNWAIGLVSGYSGAGLTIRDKASNAWNKDAFFERSEELTIEEVTGKKSYLRQALAIDTDDNFWSLPVFFEKTGGILWQGKLVPKEIIAKAVYPLRMDTTTDSYDAGAGDGVVGNSDATSWDTVHNANTGDFVDDSSTVGSIETHDSWSCSRAFFPIDTSALPDAAIISAASLYVYVTAVFNNDNDGDDWLTTVQTTQASTSSLVAADFDQCGSTHTPTEGNDSGDRRDLTGLSTSAYTSIALNATGIGWISKTGYTQLGVREGHDILDNAPADRNRATVSMSEAGASQNPYLSVTYTVPIECSLGTVAATGLQAEVEQGTTVACSLGTVTVTGLQAEVEQGTTVDCSLGTVAATGLQAEVEQGTTVACSLGTVAATGLQAEVEQGTTIACSLGTIAVTTLQAEVEQGTTISCILGTIVVSGKNAEIGTTVACGIGALVVQALAASVATSARMNLAIAISRPGGVSIAANRPGGVSIAVSRPGSVDITVS
jgi:hypothetical protein